MVVLAIFLQAVTSSWKQSQSITWKTEMSKCISFLRNIIVNVQIGDPWQIQVARVQSQVFLRMMTFWGQLRSLGRAMGEKQYRGNSFEFEFDESSNFCGRLNYRGSFKSDLFAEMRLSASEKFHPHPNFKKASRIKETNHWIR